MRKWIGGVVIAVLLLMAFGLPNVIRRVTGAPGGSWFDSLSSLIVWQRRSPPPVAGPIDPPVPAVTIDEKPTPTVRGSFCWSAGEQRLCADAIAPRDLIARFGTVRTDVPPGALVRITWPEEPLAGSVGVNLWGEGGSERVTLDAEGGFTLPSTPGRYIYDVHARWAQGDASYVFAVEIAK